MNSMTIVSPSQSITVLLVSTIFVVVTNAKLALPELEDPKPTVWPKQFHSLMMVNITGDLLIIDLWYDWPNGRNLNIMQSQLGKLQYDLEWNNGTKYIYTLDSNRECLTVQNDVGILRPNWLDGATYVGLRHVDGFLCYVWEKADFITYYEDVVTRRPVYWMFYNGMEEHLMTFDVGAVLEDEKWQVPWYCFEEKTTTLTTIADIDDSIMHQGSVLSN